MKYGTVRVATLSLNIAVTLHNIQCYVIIMQNSGKLITVFVRNLTTAFQQFATSQAAQTAACTERKRSDTISLVNIA